MILRRGSEPFPTWLTGSGRVRRVGEVVQLGVLRRADPILDPGVRAVPRVEMDELPGPGVSGAALVLRGRAGDVTTVVVDGRIVVDGPDTPVGPP